MIITITGAAGGLGSAVTEAVLAAGHTVRATDRRATRRLDTPLIVRNLLQPEGVYELVDGADAVVHIANYPNDNRVDPQTTFNENVAMNQNVFQACAEVGVKRVLYASSVQAMSGTRTGEDIAKPSCLAYLPADGDLPAVPGSSYALSKQVGETQLRYYVEMFGMTGVAFRFPAILRREHYDWLTRYSRRSHGGQWSERTRLDECFSHIPVDDAASLMVACLTAPPRGYHCFFPALMNPLRDTTMAELIAEVYPNVPLRKPIEELTELVDLSGITEKTGWVPRGVPEHVLAE